MTRLEWFESQTPEIQEKFKINCDTLNILDYFFNYWISNKNIYGADDLQGAFGWCDSPEGDMFWRELNNKCGLSQQ